MRTLACMTALSAALLFGGATAFADETAGGGVFPGPGPALGQSGQRPTTTVAAPACEALNGMPNQLHKKKGGPVRKILKGIAAETTQDLKDMADDSIFVFSANSFGPDHTTSETKPYQAYEITLMNGDIASVTAFPDQSFRITGGTFDGTCACRNNSTGHYTIYYPNGVQGSVKQVGGGSFEILRPDQTITTFKKNGDGSFRISNSKTGYAGEMTPDEGDLGWKMGPARF